MKRLLIVLLACLPFMVRAQEPTHIGQSFPLSELSYVDPAPETKGKPAIIEFWATFCAPCVKLIPHLNELYGKYKEKGLVVVGVSQDLLKEDIAPFRQKTPINYPVAFDEDGKLGVKLGVEAIPWAFVVNRQGKIIWEGLSAKLTEETLAQAMK